ncbi:DUF998 domain-containing protein [Buchananella hordeovulneris]|uniref:DUF998 domain-containing protein n=1 Tax=Buchananella hordeovulneris TaxID=52770 RepID=UPI0026DD6B76|nr:DUF998 domain-containing protein [Buchananella hordeovulneris]MDO5081634.1 DUF998 domain-containing protein [Buchananella hordeovulneris]
MTRRWWARAAALWVLVVYNSWVTAPWLSSNPQALLGYLSELAATDQPASGFYRVADSLAACGLLLIAALGWRGWRAWLGRHGAQWTAGLLALVALATIADAIWAMPCAVTLDPLCAAAYQANPFGMDHFPHVVASVTVGTGLVASVASAALARWRGGQRRSARRLLLFGALLGLSLLGSVALEVTVGLGQGVVQAGQVLLATAWAGYLAWRVDRPAGAEGAN